VKGKMETLVILTPGFAKDESDSTCIPFQQSLITTIKKNRPRLHLIILSFQYPFLESEYTWKGITVKSFGGKNKGGINRWLLWRKIKKELRRLHQQHTIAGILSFWCGECALIGHQFAVENSLVHRCWIPGQDAKKNNKYVRRFKPEAKELIAFSDFIAAEFEKNHGTRPYFIIPPGIDINLFSKKETGRTVDILGAGSLIPLKQFDLFVEMVAALKIKQPNLKAAICGEGPERKKLLLLIQEYNLQETIILTGELPHKEVLQLMQQTKIFWHPSSYEGFGLVCLEALAAGAHVISFVRPMNETIENWTIVSSREEMIGKTVTLLDKGTIAKNTVPYSVEQSTEKILHSLSL